MILLFLSASLATGCASIESPSAIVRSASIQSISADAVTVNLTVDLHNPNNVSLPIAAADYAVKVGGSRLFDGTVEPTGSVPANGTLPVDIPISFGFQRLLDVSDIIRQSDGNLLYSLDGGVSVGSFPLTRKRVPIHYDGTLSLMSIVKDVKVLLSGGAAARLAEKVLGGYFGHG